MEETEGFLRVGASMKWLVGGHGEGVFKDQGGARRRGRHNYEKKPRVDCGEERFSMLREPEK